jgi:hypothetical protein
MVQTRSDTQTAKEVKTEGGMIEVVGEFVCLVRGFNKHTDELKDIKRRKGLPNKAYFSLLLIMKSGEVLRQSKIKLFKAIIRFILWFEAKRGRSHRLLKSAYCI